jgi:hypothetical protein
VFFRLLPVNVVSLRPEVFVIANAEPDEDFVAPRPDSVIRGPTAEAATPSGSAPAQSMGDRAAPVQKPAEAKTENVRVWDYSSPAPEPYEPEHVAVSPRRAEPPAKSPSKQQAGPRTTPAARAEPAASREGAMDCQPPA